MAALQFFVAVVVTVVLSSLLLLQVPLLRMPTEATQEKTSPHEGGLRSHSTCPQVTPEKIKLDVGGTYFTTSIETLTNGKSKVFTEIFSQDQLPADTDGSFFIDMDPSLFRYILEFMRGADMSKVIQEMTPLQRGQLWSEAILLGVDDLASLIKNRFPLHSSSPSPPPSPSPYPPKRLPTRSPTRTPTSAPTNATPTDKKKLVIGIATAYPTKYRAKRMAIREGWGNFLKNTSKANDWTYKFFFGHVKDANLTALVKEEARLYGDIEILPFYDSYYNLSLKTVGMMSWAVQNYDFEYFMKTDDDSFVRVDKLMEKLETFNKTRFYGGYRKKTPYRPIRNPKHSFYVSEKQYPKKKGPNLVVGMGYVLSRDLVEYAVNYSMQPGYDPLRPEDVNTMKMMEEIGVLGGPIEGFGPIVECPCNATTVVSHWCSADQLRTYYLNVVKGGRCDS